MSVITRVSEFRPRFSPSTRYLNEIIIVSTSRQVRLSLGTKSFVEDYPSNIGVRTQKSFNVSAIFGRTMQASFHGVWIYLIK